MDGLPESVEFDAVQAALEHSKDVSGIAALIDDGRLRPDEVVAVTGKTEGCTPGETSRVDADRAIRRILADRGARSEREIEQIPMVFSAGAVGILAPQVVIYSRRPAEPVAGTHTRLTVGTGRSAIITPEWTGTERAIDLVSETVKVAARRGGVEPDEIEYVVGKTYHVSQKDLADARARGASLPEFDDRTLFRKTSGGAALAVAATVERRPLPPVKDVGVRMESWTDRACISANEWEPVAGDGPHTQLIAFANAAGVGGRLRVGHSVISDLLDVEALPRALRRAGLDVGPGPLTEAERQRVIAVYAKIGPPPDGRLRHRRQVVDNPRYASEVKVAVAGMLAAWLQDTVIFISGGATHQGPPGGGTLAAVVDVS